jgi:hypothetical protein
MRTPQSIDEVLHAVENKLRVELPALRPDLPAAAIAVVADEQGLLSAQIYGVEQAVGRCADDLSQETVQMFAGAHSVYDHDEIDALLRTLKVIAPKAGLAIEPGSLNLIELPGGVLVLTVNGQPVAASEDPLHLLSQALVGLKSMQAARR